MGLRVQGLGLFQCLPSLDAMEPAVNMAGVPWPQHQGGLGGWGLGFRVSGFWGFGLLGFGVLGGGAWGCRAWGCRAWGFGL